MSACYVLLQPAQPLSATALLCVGWWRPTHKILTHSRRRRRRRPLRLPCRARDAVAAMHADWLDSTVYSTGATTASLHENSSYNPVVPLVRLFVFFLGCMIYMYIFVCFVLPWSVESFPFMFWRWRNKLKWTPFELFAPSPLPRARSWLHPL